MKYIEKVNEYIKREEKDWNDLTEGNVQSRKQANENQMKKQGNSDPDYLDGEDYIDGETKYNKQHFGEAMKKNMDKFVEN